MRLIFNADDFGLTEGINKGIIKGFKEGVIRSTTLMVNMPFAKQALELAKENKGLGVGVHLTVTAGEQTIKIKNSLVDDKGNFYNKDLLYDYTVEFDVEDLYSEWKAQIEKFIELAGKKPTHIDSHHHIHLIPKYVVIATKLAKEYDIPMREIEWSNKEYEYIKLNQGFIGDECDIKYFLKDEGKILKEETVEVMTHPGIVDEYLKKISSYNLGRENELEILTSNELKRWIEENNIELINYRNLKK